MLEPILVGILTHGHLSCRTGKLNNGRLPLKIIAAYFLDGVGKPPSWRECGSTACIQNRGDISGFGKPLKGMGHK